jgi:Rrf2 family iron-sulfur cluster assembly transcriptional regulator
MLVRRERAMTAVAITLDVAFHATRDATVGAAEIAERLGQARRGIEPVLQALSRAGILESVRGPRGGYRLGRARRDLRLADVVRAALDGGVEAADTPVGRLQALVVAPLWTEMETLCERHLAGLTVEDLLRRAAAAGIRRTVAEPLNFAI